MGGRALQSIGIITERKSTLDFIRIGKEITKIVHEKLNIETHIVECYKEKETHGDLDVLLKIDHTFYNRGINLKMFIEETFKPKGIFSNGSVISFEYDDFQIDFIPVKESNWEVSKCFFGMDPTGNLMGKVAHSFGLKYGFCGLVFPYRFDGKKFGEIIISKDNRKIFEFLGFNYDEYLSGFNTKQEIFDYVINSKYFNPKKFMFENLNSIDRKRNEKRATYQEFIQYINQNSIGKGYQFKRKDAYYNMIDKYFPEACFKNKIKEFKKKEKERKLIASKFNGNLLMDWVVLYGKELGQAITNFKYHITNVRGFGDFNSYCMISKPDQIKSDFMNFIKKI